MLCSIVSSYRFRKFVVSDVNSELINFYEVIRDAGHTFYSKLAETSDGNSRIEYNSRRSRFNSILGDEETRLERAILFMYLNRHSYNGLWRVNSKGEYNVPFGRYTHPGYPSEENIVSFSDMLSKVTLQNVDFEESVKEAKENDFVYFDPPYEPESRTANFTSYSTTGFDSGEQERLANVCKVLDSNNVKFMVSNSNTVAVRHLYRNFNFTVLSARRSINSNASARAGMTELVITNY